MTGGNEPVQGARLEIGASEKQLEQGLDAAASVVHKFTQDANRQFAQMSSRIQGYVDKIDATEATTRLGMLEQAVGKLGGTSNLTAPQLARVQVELQKLADQGGRVPASLQAINKETDKLTAAAKAAASGQGWSGVLGAMAPKAVAAAAGVAGLTAAAGLAGDQIGKLVLQTAGYAANIKNLSESYNINTHALQRMGAAAADSDVPLQSVLSASKNIAKELVNSPEKFQQLGFQVEKLIAMSPDEQFFAVADGLRAMTNETQQTVAAQELLGKGGSEILRMLKSDMRGAADEAERMGRIMGEDQLRAAAELKNELDKLDQTLQGLGRNTATLITGNENLALSVRTLREVIGDLSRFAQQNQDDLRLYFSAGADSAAAALPPLRLVLGVFREINGFLDKARERASRKDIELPETGKRAPRATVEVSETVDQTKTHNAIAKVEEQAEKRRREVRARNRELDGKASAEALARETKRVEEQSQQLLTIKIRESAIRRDIDEAAQASRRDAEQRTSEWLRKRAKNDAAVVADAEAAKAEARRMGMPAIDAQIDRIAEATNAAIHHINVLEDEGKIGSAAADRAREAYEDAYDAETKYAKQAEALNKIAKVRDLFGELVGMLDELGVSAESNLGKAARAGEQLAGAVESGAMAVAAFESGDYLTAAKEGLKSLTQLVKGIKTLFSEPSWKKVGREAGRILGTEISEELAKEIEKTSKDLKISVEAASLLNLSRAIQDSRRDAREFGVQISQLMAGIANGSVPAREGIEELGTLFGEVRDAAAAAGVVGDATLVAIVKQAKELGQLTPEMQAFLDEQAVVAQEGAKKIADGMSQITTGTVHGEDWAIRGADAADFFGYGFQQAIAEKGLLGAIDEQGEGLHAFYEKARAAGDEAALAILGPFEELNNQLGDKGDLRGALTTLEGMDQVFQAMANNGDLTAQRTDAMGRSIQGTFNALLEGGVSEAAALQAIQPELRHLVSAAQQYGYELDANTQRLVDQSREAGFAFPTEPIVQVVDLLRAIATQMGAEIPASARRSAQAFGEVGAASAEAFEDTTASSSAAAEAVTTHWDGGAASIEERALEMRETVAGEMLALADESVLAGEDMASEVAGAIEDLAADSQSEIAEMTRDFDQELSLWGGIAREATDEIKDAIDTLPDVLDIPIRLHGPTPGAFGFNFDGSPDDDGDKTNGFRFGGIEDFGRESIVAVHGKEAIVPEGGAWFMDMLRQATREGMAEASTTRGGAAAGPRTVVVQIDGREIARVVVDELEDNRGGAGKRAAAALNRHSS